MPGSDWESELDRFVDNPTPAGFRQMTETIPFASFCLYLSLPEATSSTVSKMVPVLERALDLDEVVSDFVVKPTMTRICALSDVPIISPLSEGSRGATDRFEAADEFVGLLRKLSYTEYYPDRRRCLRRVMLYMIQVLGATALCVPAKPQLRKGVELFGEWLAGLWLNMVDAEDTGVAENMVALIRHANRVQRVVPKEAWFESVIVSFDGQWDEQLLRWHRNDLSPDELDSVNIWLMTLPPTLLSRVQGEATLLGDVDVSTCRVRAAVSLIRMADTCPLLTSRANAEEWIVKIVANLHFTNDVLLKMAACEVMLTELLESPWGCQALFEHSLVEAFMAELDAAPLSKTAALCVTRLVANIFERVPASRALILASTHCPTVVEEVRRMLVSFGPNKATGISCVGSLAVGLNEHGVWLLANRLNEWRQEFLVALKAGDEHTATAVVMALVRMVGGSAAARGAAAAPGGAATPPPEAASASAATRVLDTIEQDMVPLLIDITYKKPFMQLRVDSYKLFEALMVTAGRFAPARLYMASAERMKQLFAPDSDQVNDVVQSRHHYLKRLHLFIDEVPTTGIEPELVSGFRESLEYAATHGPYDKPPRYQHQAGTILEDEAGA